MQMKDLNVRPPLRAFCPLNPLADARERGKRKKEGKEMRGFEIRCQSGSSIYNALNHFPSSKRLSSQSRKNNYFQQFHTFHPLHIFLYMKYLRNFQKIFFFRISYPERISNPIDR
ncbi:hypothetical protein [Akkermansia sp.]|uniref:hypothetical protein n=1 Tax=Akkermansia sp. TaxID=1872421 RepID=UPI003AB8578D